MPAARGGTSGPRPPHPDAAPGPPTSTAARTVGSSTRPPALPADPGVFVLSGGTKQFNTEPGLQRNRFRRSRNRLGESSSWFVAMRRVDLRNDDQQMQRQHTANNGQYGMDCTGAAKKRHALILHLCCCSCSISQRPELFLFYDVRRSSKTGHRNEGDADLLRALARIDGNESVEDNE